MKYAIQTTLAVVLTISCGEQTHIDRIAYNPQSSDQVIDNPVITETSEEIDNPLTPLPPITLPTTEPSPPSLEQVIQMGLDSFDMQTIEEELTFISHDDHNGRLSGTRGNETVADYLIGHLQDLGVEPGLDSGYLQEFTIKNGPTRGQGTANIIGVIPGQDEVLKDEYIVIGAHMDHAGTLSLGYTCSPGKSGSNQICNGADDNGSGTIGLLNVVKALSKVRKHLKRSVVVAWFSGEELGLEGSWHYVRNPIFPIDQTVYMMNLDMIGYAHTNQNRVSALGGGSSKSAEQFIRNLDQKYDFLTTDISPQAGGGSDHVPFMAEGIPGVFFHTGVANNPNYHKTSDTVEKISFEGLTTIAEMSFELIHFVANDVNMSVPRGVTGELIKRKPLVTEAEKSQSCHHLILNPYINKVSNFMQSGTKLP